MTKDDPQDSYRISPENTVAWAVAARTLQAFSRGEVTEMLEHAAIRKPDGKIASATTVKKAGRHERGMTWLRQPILPMAGRQRAPRAM